MNVQFILQDPTASKPTYVADSIADACRGAKFGRGIFAFATVAGVELLFEYESVRELTSDGRFELIVGIDAITNRETLELLRQLAAKHRGFQPKVFWNSGPSLFHPKFCHFANRTKETWIIGSGNLTPRGLRDNYEAFSVVRGVTSDVKVLSKAMARFLMAHCDDIRDIDSDALARAALNTFQQPIRLIEPARGRVIETDTAGADSTADALIAELPRGGDRWQQANFDVATSRAFFGVDPLRTITFKELLLSEIDGDGVAVSDEVRRFTFTRSRNLRLHLGARRGESYPARARPIAIFRKLNDRRFLYQLLIPSSPGFSDVRRLLDTHDDGDVRRLITTVVNLRAHWRASPFG